MPASLSDMASGDFDVTFVTVLYKGEDVPEHSKGVFTPEWADRLYRGIARNCTRPFRFVCYTDDPEYEFSEPVQNRPLQLPCRNMFSLLECFRENLGRVVFMGLDTVITGNIDFLADYHGPFRMLKDPWLDRGCSGVMLFGYMPELWAEIREGYERYAEDNTMFDVPSDMIFLDKWPHEILDGPSNGILSYKAHIKPSPALIRQAKIVYFHGEEKPHQLAGLPWVDEHWGAPMQEPAPYIRTLNNSIEAITENIVVNAKRGLPKFNGGNARHAIICAGGPSLKDRVGKFPEGDVFALNGAHDFLIGNGVVPDFHVVLDSRPENVCFVQNPDPRVKYLICAQCHPDVFDALEGYDVTVWHTTMSNGLVDALMIAGGATVGLKTLYLTHQMGYRDYSLYGFDSCYADDRDHAYEQALKSGAGRVEVTANGRKFVCDPWMVEQARDFQKAARTLTELGCRIRIFGDGLISWIMKPQEATDAR